jgi:hypothetical protein
MPFQRDKIMINQKRAKAIGRLEKFSLNNLKSAAGGQRETFEKVSLWNLFKTFQ